MTLKLIETQCYYKETQDLIVCNNAPFHNEHNNVKAISPTCQKWVCHKCACADMCVCECDKGEYLDSLLICT